MFYPFGDNCKIASFTRNLKEAKMKITYACPLSRVITEIIKRFKSFYGCWGRCLNIRYVCMDLEPCFKVHTLVSVYPKSIKLGQITILKTLNVIFHVVMSDYRLVKL